MNAPNFASLSPFWTRLEQDMSEQLAGITPPDGPETNDEETMRHNAAHSPVRVWLQGGGSEL